MWEFKPAFAMSLIKEITEYSLFFKLSIIPEVEKLSTFMKNFHLILIETKVFCQIISEKLYQSFYK